MAALGHDKKTGKAIDLPRSVRSTHLYVIGVTGTGKSTLLLLLILACCAAGLGLLVCDPNVDLVKNVLRCLPKSRHKDVILLNPSDYEHPFGLNLFTCLDPTNPIAVSRTASVVVGVFRKLFGSTWGPRLEDVLRNVALTFIENPGHTLADVPLLFEDEHFRARLIRRVTNRQVRRFWERYDSMSPAAQREFTESTSNKIRAFLSQPLLENIFGQPTTTVDFRAAMDSGKIILLPLASGIIGQDAATLIGSVVVGQATQATLARANQPESQRRRFAIYIDELQNVVTDDIETLAAQARKYRVELTVAHQFIKQLDERTAEAVSQIPSRIVFKVTAKDAAALSSSFNNVAPSERSIHPHPLKHVLSRGHTDLRAVELANDVEHFAQAAESACIATMDELNRDFISPKAAFANDLERGIDRFLRWAMTTDGNISVEAAVRALRGHFYFGAIHTEAHPHERQVEALRALSRSVSALAQRLRAVPVSVDTARYETDGLATASLMKAKLANDLSSQPPHHCFVSFVKDGKLVETQIKTLPPPPVINTGFEIGLMRKRSRDLYCRPRADVEEEITRRQDGDKPMRISRIAAVSS